MNESFTDSLICKDCKYSSKLLGTLMCSRPTGRLDVTTGKEHTLYKSCRIERMYDSDLRGLQCGPTGRFYQDSQWKKVKLFFNKQ